MEDGPFTSVSFYNVTSHIEEEEEEEEEDDDDDNNYDIIL